MGARFEGEHDGNGGPDAFFHEDTTQKIISYLSEDARFCFALTSKKNRERIDTWNARHDIYVRHRTDPQFKRAYVLHEAAREGHLEVIRWLALDMNNNVSVVCSPAYASHSLFETYTCHPRHYYALSDRDWAAFSYDTNSKEEKMDMADFGCEGNLWLSDVAARYGRDEIVRWIDVNFGMNPCQRDMAYAMAVIGGHRHLYDLRSLERLSSTSLRMILQRAPIDEMKRLVRITDYDGKHFPFEYIVERGNTDLLHDYYEESRENSPEKKREHRMPRMVQNFMISAAIMSGGDFMLEYVTWMVCPYQEVSQMEPHIDRILMKMLWKWLRDDDKLLRIIRVDARMGRPSVIERLIDQNKFYKVEAIMDRIRSLPPDKRGESWTDDRIDDYMRRTDY